MHQQKLQRLLIVCIKYLDHLCTDLQPELTKWESLCERFASSEWHLQDSVMLFVSQRGKLRHVNFDLAHSDEPVIIMAMLCGCLDLKHVLLHSKAAVRPRLCQACGFCIACAKWAVLSD